MSIGSQPGPYHGKKVVLRADVFEALHGFALEYHYEGSREAREDGYGTALRALLSAVGYIEDDSND